MALIIPAGFIASLALAAAACAAAWLASAAFRIPRITMMILAGMCLGLLPLQEIGLFQPGSAAWGIIAAAALSLASFEAASKIRLAGFGSLHHGALKLSILFISAGVFAFAAFSGISGWMAMLPAVLLALLMAASSSEAFASAAASAGRTASKYYSILSAESAFSAPVAASLPFIILFVLQHAPSSSSSAFGSSQFLVWAASITLMLLSGIGAAVLVALCLVRLLRIRGIAKDSLFSHSAVAASAVLAYILAESMGGLGVVASASLGLFVGNAFPRSTAGLKLALLPASGFHLSRAFFALVFVLIGIMAELPSDPMFWILSASLFLVYIAARIASSAAAFASSAGILLKEKIFISLNMPKGAAAASAAFAISLHPLAPGEPGILLGIFAVLLIASNILSMFISSYHSYFEKGAARR